MICKFMEEKQRLEDLIVEIERELVRLPEDTFCSVKNGSGTKWYYYKNGERHYIPKENRRLAE